jgi:hypothetical protein
MDSVVRVFTVGWLSGGSEDWHQVIEGTACHIHSQSVYQPQSQRFLDWNVKYDKKGKKFGHTKQPLNTAV